MMQNLLRLHSHLSRSPPDISAGHVNKVEVLQKKRMAIISTAVGHDNQMLFC